MRRLICALALIASSPAFGLDLDPDGDGSVTRAELEAATIARFGLADSNHDGLLDSSELAAAFADPAQLLYIVDADQNGALNEDEWRGYASGATAIAFMLCDADENNVLSGAEIACTDQE
jgi:EF hand